MKCPMQCSTVRNQEEGLPFEASTSVTAGNPWVEQPAGEPMPANVLLHDGGECWSEHSCSRGLGQLHLLGAIEFPLG